MTTECHSDIESLIADEIAKWEAEASVASESERIKIHGAVSLLSVLAGIPKQITAEFLRNEYKYYKERAEHPCTKDRELAIINQNRAVKSCEAIVRLGKRVVELDKAK